MQSTQCSKNTSESNQSNGHSYDLDLKSRNSLKNRQFHDQFLEFTLKIQLAAEKLSNTKHSLHYSKSIYKTLILTDYLNLCNSAHLQNQIHLRFLTSIGGYLTPKGLFLQTFVPNLRKSMMKYSNLTNQEMVNMADPEVSNLVMTCSDFGKNYCDYMKATQGTLDHYSYELNRNHPIFKSGSGQGFWKFDQGKNIDTVFERYWEDNEILFQLAHVILFESMDLVSIREHKDEMEDAASIDEDKIYRHCFGEKIDV